MFNSLQVFHGAPQRCKGLHIAPPFWQPYSTKSGNIGSDPYGIFQKEEAERLLFLTACCLQHALFCYAGRLSPDPSQAGEGSCEKLDVKGR